MVAKAPGEKRDGLRADARRNRENILKTAVRHFRSRGVDASLDEIARDAGVGSGTLYRHFPSREALLAATLMERQAELMVRAETARAMADADAALTAWLHALQDYLRTYDGLPAPVLATIENESCPLSLSCDTLIALTEEFLTRAQHERVARASITARDLFLSTLGIAWVVNRVGPNSAQQRALETIIADGYREPNETP